MGRTGQIVFVMARTNQEYMFAVSQHPNELMGARYLHNADQLRGTQYPIVYKYGRHYDHPDYQRIEEYLVVCRATVRYI